MTVLNVEIFDARRMFLDIFAARLDIVAHQKREHALGFDGILHRDLNHLAAFGVHRRFPQLMGVHFTQTFVTLNLKSLPAVLLDLLKKLRQRVDLNFIVSLPDAEDRSLTAEKNRRVVTAFTDSVAEFKTGFRLEDRRYINGGVKSMWCRPRSAEAFFRLPR